jgi:hypothetical protein
VRTALRDATGADTIPALRLENGSAIVGEENIFAFLGEQFAEPLGAETHQQKAAKARRRSIVGNEQLAPIAADVKRRLGDVVAKVGRTNGRP